VEKLLGVAVRHFTLQLVLTCFEFINNLFNLVVLLLEALQRSLDERGDLQENLQIQSEVSNCLCLVHGIQGFKLVLGVLLDFLSLAGELLGLRENVWELLHDDFLQCEDELLERVVEIDCVLNHISLEMR
jgi:hypothetical protein